MAESQWEVTVDPARCVGSGVCVAVAAGHFAVRDRRSHAVQPVTGPDDAVLDAAETCPMEAILVREAGSGTLLAPVE
ncbi:ferredoxin [Streptomyces sp. HUAS TT20]|uniref:ferredoxin n=1 Tax=Streptomyces sp. HUAS TT20 TaxID=3447509 RepID=UPI0021D8094E|nr:ferredoxin [Streptomyces sp. HUAS 15-9]UXY30484.1 ferredoxin [Streptomyces sp. HUAS 15-9]